MSEPASFRASKHHQAALLPDISSARHLRLRNCPPPRKTMVFWSRFDSGEPGTGCCLTNLKDCKKQTRPQSWPSSMLHSLLMRFQTSSALEPHTWHHENSFHTISTASQVQFKVHSNSWTACSFQFESQLPKGPRSPNWQFVNLPASPRPSGHSDSSSAARLRQRDPWRAVSLLFGGASRDCWDGFGHINSEEQKISPGFEAAPRHCFVVQTREPVIFWPVFFMVDPEFWMCLPLFCLCFVVHPELLCPADQAAFTRPPVAVHLVEVEVDLQPETAKLRVDWLPSVVPKETLNVQTIFRNVGHDEHCSFYKTKLWKNMEFPIWAKNRIGLCKSGFFKMATQFIQIWRFRLRDLWVEHVQSPQKHSWADRRWRPQVFFTGDSRCTSATMPQQPLCLHSLSKYI